MIQPKYSPEEALERIKLMMKYDSSKTLNENKKVIFEEEETAASAPTDANTVTVTDLMGDTGKIRQYIQMLADFDMFGIPKISDIFGFNPPNLLAGRRTGVKGVVDALDGYVDLEDLGYVLTTLKSLDGKCFYDDIEEKKIPAIEKFLQLYNEDEDEDLAAEVEGVGTRTLSTGAADVKRAIAKTIETLRSQSCSSTAPVAPDPTEDGGAGGGTGGGTGGYKDCSGSYSYGCKSSVIAKVQGCLGGLVQDGKFGPKTQAALKAKGFESFTDADVDKICGIDSIEDTDVQDVEGTNPNQI